MSQDKKVLNQQQKEAVEHSGGPLLVIAGAGTGKTTVITERIKYLILKKKLKPNDILALTFTDKAAREMEHRVDIALPYGFIDMWISTFHSFCDRVLRDEAIQIGLDPAYRLMGQAETIQFLSKNLFKFKLDYYRPLGNPTKFVEGMIQHFSRLKDEDVKPGEYLGWAKSQIPIRQPADKSQIKDKEKQKEAEKFLELARAYKRYEELKAKEGVMDFADLISNTLKLFRRRENVLSRYQKRFKHILVDEFQDTNIAQNELAMLMAGKKGKITVTGDDDQSIYRFRGAAVSNMIQFRDRFPKAKVIVLSKNYRSTQTVLNHAYRLIQNNNPDRLEVKEDISKHLKSVRGIKGEPIEFVFADRVEDEAQAVADEILKLTGVTNFNSRSSRHSEVDPPAGGRPEESRRGSSAYQWKDFAILVRANNHAEPFVRALGRAGIPYQFLGPGQLFRRPEVKDMIAYLKLLYNFEDSVAAFKVLSMDHFEINARDLAAIGNFARKNNFSLFEACEQVEKIFVKEETKEKIGDFVQMVRRHLGLLAKETAGQIAYYFLEDSGLLQKLTEYKTIEEEKTAQNIAKFFDRLKTYEAEHEDASVRAVVDWITLSLDLGESPLATNFDWEAENRVNILTVHSSKGLEFPVVLLVNLVSARFPTRRRREKIPLPEELVKEILPEGDYHLQEERRLFYVGMTRARDRLFFTAAKYYGEGKREKKTSQFISEALGKQKVEQVLTNQEVKKKTEQLSILDFSPSPQPTTQPATHSSQPITYLSYSQINSFDTCPLQYRYRYLQRIPTPPSAALTFGSTMHEVLKEFYEKLVRGEEMSCDKLFSLLEEKWSPIGFASKAHEKRMKKQGKKMLKNFYHTRFDPQIKVDKVEEKFVVKVKSDFKVGGRIDRIDKTKDGIKIIDYKTGKVWEQKKVDKSLQMTLYALAAASSKSSLFYRLPPEKVQLSFCFLKTGEVKRTQRDKKDLEKVKEELLEKKSQIEKSNFSPKPGPWCDFCDFKLICEAWN